MIGLSSDSGKSNSRFQLGNRGSKKSGFRIRARSARPHLSGEWLHQERLRTISPKTRQAKPTVYFLIQILPVMFPGEQGKHYLQGIFWKYFSYRKSSESSNQVQSNVSQTSTPHRKFWERPLLHSPKGSISKHVRVPWSFTDVFNNRDRKS